MTRMGQIRPEVLSAAYTAAKWEPVDAPIKPSREFCKQQARKLAGKPFAPSDPVAYGVVIDAITEFAQSEDHAQRIVASLLLNVDRWPDVPSIRDAAIETKQLFLMPDDACAECKGSGYIFVKTGGSMKEFDCRFCDKGATCDLCGGTGKVTSLVGYETHSRKCSCWRLSRRVR